MVAFVALLIGSPETVVQWLPPAVREEEREAILRGLQNTRQSLQQTGGAVLDVALRLWLDKTPPDDTRP